MVTIGERSVLITADDREERSGVVEALRAMPGVEVGVARLSVGDYKVGAGPVFERKTLADLAASVADGRLFRQALRLAAVPMGGAIILEGRWSEGALGGMRREAVQGALISVSLFIRVPVLRSFDPAETARLLVYSARQAGEFAGDALPRPGRRPKGKRRLQLWVLQGLPGVGPERARRLLTAFGSVEAVVTAAPEQLQTVTGIGPHTARAIRWAVT